MSVFLSFKMQYKYSLLTFFFCFVNFSWARSYTYSNEVGYGSPYGYSPSVTTPQTMGYELSADYVDSTTTYEPRSTIMDSDFIGGHSEYIYIVLIYKQNYRCNLFLTMINPLYFFTVNILTKTNYI